MIELKHLRTLQALRNTGSLAAAATQLHQTQSALSHQFSDLEQRLGFVCLCVKASRYVSQRKVRSCCNWRNKCCRKSSKRCKPATNHTKLHCVSPSNVIAVFNG